MRRNLSILRRIFCVGMMLAVLIGMQAGPVAAGWSCSGCAAVGDDAAPAKEPCPKGDASCIVGGRCAVGCSTDTPFHSAAASISPDTSVSASQQIGGSESTSHSLKPDPYPPRFGV
jgi:hypothetical protein